MCYNLSVKANDEQMIRRLQATLLAKIRAGEKCGPFSAAVVGPDGAVVAESENSVVPSGCSHNHISTCRRHCVVKNSEK